MPDEKDKLEDSWTMPEPVFRSSEGRSVKSDVDTESDIPTEQANRDFPTEAGANVGSQSIRPTAGRNISNQNKGKSFWERNATGLIVLAALLIGALIYLAWLYRDKIL